MSTEQFTYLSELVEDIKATGDAAIAATACRALNDLLRFDLTPSGEEYDA